MAPLSNVVIAPTARTGALAASPRRRYRRGVTSPSLVLALVAATLPAETATAAPSRPSGMAVPARATTATLVSPGLPVRVRLPSATRKVRLELRHRAGRRTRLVSGSTLRLRRVPRGRATLRLRLPSKVAQRVRPGRRYVVTLRARDRHGRGLGPPLRTRLAIVVRRPSVAPTPAPVAAPVATPQPPAAPDPVVAAAGDISCPSPCAQVGTAALVADVIKPVAVLGLGDFQYPESNLGLYRDFYDPSWGRFKGITYATPGNHDAYGTGDFLTYFNAGGPVTLQPESSYSFDIGTWHVVSLDSYCFVRTTCDEQAWGAWLQGDLAAHPAKCTLAFFHEPYWTTKAAHARTTILKPWIRLLYDAGADLVLQAHEHSYERFAPQDPDDRADPARGIASFVVGTGGMSHTAFSGPPAANSVVRDDTTFGVLALTLHAAGYDFRFVPVPGASFSDAGSGTCH
jgi:hypothetical protein